MNKRQYFNYFYVILFFVLFSIGCNEKQAVIKVDLSEFQNIKPTDSISTFTIKNNGDKALVIEDYTSSCQCTVVNLSKGLTIMPADSVVVKLNFKRNENKTKVHITLKSNTNPIFTNFFISI
jgi:hypothetical protein